MSKKTTGRRNGRKPSRQSKGNLRYSRCKKYKGSKGRRKRRTKSWRKRRWRRSRRRRKIKSRSEAGRGAE